MSKEQKKKIDNIKNELLKIFVTIVNDATLYGVSEINKESQDIIRANELFNKLYSRNLD